MADSLTLRGTRRVLNHTGTEVTLKRPSTGRDQFAFKRWWISRTGDRPYTFVTRFDVARPGGALVLLVEATQDTELQIEYDGDETFTFPHSSESRTRRAAVYSADLSTLHLDIEFPKFPGMDAKVTTVNGITDLKTIGTVTVTGDAAADQGIATGNYSYSLSGNATAADVDVAWSSDIAGTFSDSTGQTTTATFTAAGNATVTCTVTAKGGSTVDDGPTAGTTATVVTATGAAATFNNFATTTAFTASQTDEACTQTATDGNGSGGTFTYTSDGAGDLTAITVTGGGTLYKVGETVTFTEGAGTPGVGTATVATIA